MLLLAVLSSVGVVVSFTEWFEWMGLERFLGPHAKVIVAAIGLLVVLGTLAGYIFRYLHARIMEKQHHQLTALLDDQKKLLEEQRKKLEQQEVGLERKNLVLQQAADALKGQKADLSAKEAGIMDRERKLDNVRNAFHGQEHDLWCMHPATMRDRYAATLSAFQKTKPIILVANLKGGVGKSTLSANLAAYFKQSGKRVLLIDADYQGSLSNMLLLADGVEKASPELNRLLQAGASPESFRAAAHAFQKRLVGSSLIASKYELASMENRVMVEHLLQEDALDDGRYRLAKLLLNDEVAQTFDVALIDAPPRLTAGTINGFCAATHLLVPTVYDNMSAEAVGTFLNSVQSLRRHLNPGIEFLGVVGMLTAQQTGLKAEEERARRIAEQQVRHVWGNHFHFFSRHIPRKAAIAKVAGDDIAYFCDEEVRSWFDELGTAVASRLWPLPYERSLRSVQSSDRSHASAVASLTA